MQERKFQDVSGEAHLLSARDEAWAANHKQFLGTQAGNMEPAPCAVAMPDGNIDILTRKVDMRHRGGNPQIDFGMRLGEEAQTRHEPLGRKIR